MLTSVENMSSQINFYAKVSLRPAMRREMHLGSSKSSFESDVVDMKPGAREELDAELGNLDEVFGRRMDEPIRAAVEMTLKRLMQLGWQCEQHFAAMKREIEARDLSLKEADQMQQY